MPLWSPVATPVNDETYIGEAEFGAMPPMMGAIGAFGGIRVLESPMLKYDEMFLAQTQQAIVVGEIAHFRYRLNQLNANQGLRKAVKRNIQAAAERILGEPWTVGES